MLSALAKSVVAGAALSLMFAAYAPSTAKAAVAKSSVVLVEDAPAAAAPAAEGGGKVWIAFMWPETLKPQLEEKKILLTILGVFLPLGSVWGPIVLLGQGFDMEWALPSLIYSIVAWPGAWFAGIGWLLFNWIATQTMFANLNRPEITVGGGEAAAAPATP